MTLLYKDYLKTDLWKENKEKAIKRDDYKCTRCGSTKNLEFHHINPKEKDITLSRSIYSWERTKNELKKCICVCANCHREIHSKEWNIKKNELLRIHNNSVKYGKDIDDKIVYMKDVENKSFYQISKELNIHRDTIMSHYHKYKK